MTGESQIPECHVIR